MATKRYAKNTQTESGTTGTPADLGAICDLSTTQGSTASLGTGNLHGAGSFDSTPVKSFTMTVGAGPIADGTQNYNYSVKITASGEDTHFKPRIRRVNSSGSTQATSSFGTTVDAGGNDIIGTWTGTISFDAGTWVSGDRIVLDIHGYEDGPSTQSFTMAVNDADTWLETVDGSGGSTYTASAAVTINGADCAGVADYNSASSGTAAVTINGADASGSATRTAPTYTAAAAVTINNAEANAVASSDLVFTAVGAVTTPAATCAGVATFRPEVIREEEIIRDAFFAELTRYRGIPTQGSNGIFAIERSGGAVITPTAFAPAAATHRGAFYYNVNTNTLYRKVVTARGPGYVIAHWKQASE